MVVISIVGDGLFSLKCILNLYWNNYSNSGRYFNSGCNVKLSLKFILNHYWNNYFNSGRYFNSGCNVMFSLKFILNHYWNNYFNSGRYFNSGCDVKLSLKFILNNYWNNYFNSGRYFNSGCNRAHIYIYRQARKYFRYNLTKILIRHKIFYRHWYFKRIVIYWTLSLLLWTRQNKPW